MRWLLPILIVVLGLGSGPLQACPYTEQFFQTAPPSPPRPPEELIFVGEAAFGSGLPVKGFPCHTRIDGVKVAGYKAGLTSQAAQARFETDGPLLGVLFEPMILADGAVIDLAGTKQPRWEADLLLVVGDEAINTATDRRRALRALRGYRPFIEVPDLGYAPAGRAMTAQDLRRVNVGAWRGAAGPELPLPRNALADFAAMRVRAFDETGALLGEGKGSDVMGHPLDVVLWVRDRVLAQGGWLRPGDVISVGSFTALTPPKPGQRITVRYEGLPGTPEVSVSFR